MGVAAIDHVNICTPDVPATAAFLADVLDMRITPSPGASDPALASWMRDDEDRPIFHLVSMELMRNTSMGAGDGASGSGRVHHIALLCTGHDDVMKRLERRGAAYRTMVPAAGHRTIFTTDPNGIALELNFRDE